MLKARYIAVVMCGLMIDALQAAISWISVSVGTVLTAVTPVGGGVGGAVAGAALCWNNSTGGVLQGIKDAAACAAAGGTLGAAASALGTPIGIALGFVLNICIALTLGAGFMMLLIFTGLFTMDSIKKSSLGFIAELIPGINNIPFWTFMAIYCVVQHSKKENSRATVATSVAAAALTPTKGIMTLKEKTMDRARAARGLRSEQQTQSEQPNTVDELTDSTETSNDRQRLALQDIRTRSTNTNVQLA